MTRQLSLSAALLLLCAASAASQSAKPDTGKKKDLPLAASRTIEIDTDEGSWLSVDVAPDGKAVVFDLLGDVYMVPLLGGSATPVTTGMAFDGQPRYSPDGKWIAFTSDRDGAEKRLDHEPRDEGDAADHETRGQDHPVA